MHVPTMAVSRGLVELMLAGLIWFVAHRDTNVRGPEKWALGFFVNGLSLLFFPVQSETWDRALTIINHTALGVSHALLLLGFWQFNGQAIRHKEQVTVTAVLIIPVVSLILWEFAVPNSQYRILTTIFSHLIFLFSLQAALARPLRSELSPHYLGLRILVTIYLLFALWSYANLTDILPQTASAPSDYHRAIFSALSLLFMLALAVGFLALQFSRLILHNADLAMIDWLTGLVNRRGLMHQAERDDAIRRRDGSRSAVVCLDIDFFKSINDRFGHAAGDEVLKRLAGILSSCARAGDIVARLGGEEFALVLAGVDEQAALQVAERIRLTCADASVSYRSTEVIRFTVSLGACETLMHEPLMKTIDRADQALYAAKSKGRNCAVGLSSLPVAASAKG